MGHLNEIKNRLFWVTLAFIVSAALVYPFFTEIVSLLTEPLHGEELHYFSPAGGLSFIIKICMYLGVVGALPFFVYHLYKFVQPIMTVRKTRSLIGYTVSSALLAMAGIAFTYTIILPAAVRFLTSFEIAGVDPMLSVDAYMSFVIAYIVAGALLFQLPLLMLIVDGISPLTPKTLLSYEKHIIIGAFVAGALLSPTPDVINQMLLALPLIVMYQIGFVIIVLRAKVRHRKRVEPMVSPLPTDTFLINGEDTKHPTPAMNAALPVSTPVAQLHPAHVPTTASQNPLRSMDGMLAPLKTHTVPSNKKVQQDVYAQRPVKRGTLLSTTIVSREIVQERRTVPRYVQRPNIRPQQLRSLDGFSIQTY